jgi:hypothetical protein
MPRLFSVLAVAAAFIPAVFANQQIDCNVSRIDLIKADETRAVLASTNTDFQTTRYDANISGAISDVVFAVTQNGATTAEFTISLNGEVVNAVAGNVDNPTVFASDFNTACGADNLVLLEVAEVKNLKQRYDSCHFKYEVHYHNPRC